MPVKSALTSIGRRRPGRAAGLGRLPHFVAAAMLLSILAGGLAGCGSTSLPNPAALQPRGASVAFDSIDGPPPAQFQTLVRALNDEAQSRQLAVISREGSSAYRVRGYLTARTDKGRTTIAWLWEVFDRDGHSTLRINGEETAGQPGKNAKPEGKADHDAWRVADDAMLHRIARVSMDRLAAFLTSPSAAPGADDSAVAMSNAPAGTPVVQQIGLSDTSPEAKGIYRIFRAHADPALEDDPNAPDPAKVDTKTAPHPAEASPAPADRRAARTGPLELATAER